MQPSHQRLTRRDIYVLLRRGYKHHRQLFSYYRTPQHRRSPRSQWSIQIPVKLDKRATVRNRLKRIAIEEFEHALFDASVHAHYKAFVVLQKKSIPKLVQMIASTDKRHIVQSRRRLCKDDFR
jgi:RNase P protein component